MLKFVALGAVFMGGAYMMGALDSPYRRVVDRPPADVLRGLDDLDIGRQPGAPGTDPSASGGVKPLFSHEATPQGMVWTVRSGDQIAIRMFADLKPVDDGRHTQVTTRVERGDAPDDFVSPAFRSKGIALGLFSMAVESELDKLTLPKGDPAKCREITDGFLTTAPRRDPAGSGGLIDAVGRTSRDVMQIAAMGEELRRNGCPTGFKEETVPPMIQGMTPSEDAAR